MSLRIAGFTIIGSVTPGEDPVTTGYLWADTGTGKLKQATSIAPYVWTEIGPFSGSATPLAHAASHAVAGSDPVTLAESQITNLTTDLAAKEVAANKNAASGYAGLDGSSKLTGAQQVYGTIANTACAGNDSRLSDSRTPTAHAASHAAAASDPLTLSESQITGLVAALATIPAAATSVTTLDGTAVVGVATTYARSDHKHDLIDTTHTGNIVINGTTSAQTGLLTITQNYAGDAADHAVLKVKRNTQANSGTPTIGDGAEVVFCLKDTNGNYGSVAGVMGRLVTVDPTTMKGRLELAVKNTGIFSVVEEVKAIVDWDGKIGIGTFFGTITNAPAESLHIYDGTSAALIQTTGVGGAAGWCLLGQGQRWNMSVGADNAWNLYDNNLGRNRISVAATSGIATFDSPIIGAMNLPVYTNSVGYSQTLASGQICNIFGTLTITAGTITIASGASMNIMGIPNGI